MTVLITVQDKPYLRLLSVDSFFPALGVWMIGCYSCDGI